MAVAFDLAADVVELAPYVPPSVPAAPLREVAFRHNAWLADEIALLRSMFDEDRSIEEIAAALGRGRAGVSTKFYELGLRRNSSRPWTELDDAELIKRYGMESSSQIAQDLGRSSGAVYFRAFRLGLSEAASPPYTEWELAQVRAGYSAGVPVFQVAQLIGRTLSSVNSMACHLKIPHASAPDFWSLEETSRALSLASEGHRYLAIIEMLVEEGFPRRSKAGLGPKLKAMGYGRGWGRSWTSEEDDLLRAAYANGASLTPLTDRLGRGIYSIRWRAGELGLRGTHVSKAGWRTEPVWTEAERGIVRANYGKIPNKDLAKRLNRSLRAVYTLAHHLGLEFGNRQPYSADEDLALRIAWKHDLTISQTAAAIGRADAAVFKRMQKLGLSWSSPARPRLPVAFEGKPTLQQILTLDRTDLPPVNDLTPKRRRGRPKTARAPAQPLGAQS